MMLNCELFQVVLLQYFNDQLGLALQKPIFLTERFNLDFASSMDLYNITEARTTIVKKILLL